MLLKHTIVKKAELDKLLLDWEVVQEEIDSMVTTYYFKSSAVFF
jgi:hypothetical protein